MKNKPICSLNIRNKNSVIRQVGTGILGPNQSGLFHFKTLTQLNHAINLEKKNQIAILTDIPSYVALQNREETAVDTEGELAADSVVPVVTEQLISLEKVKPDWYLSWEEVEGKSKPELQNWFEKNPAEGLSIPKNKNAAATKEIVHAFLAGQFEDHAAPVEEVLAEGEEQPVSDK